MAKPVLMTVDDDADVLRAVERDLRHRYADRYRVISADSGATALDALRGPKKRNDTVARIVRQHHGEIRVDSQPGNTQFTVDLPVQQPRTQ